MRKKKSYNFDKPIRIVRLRANGLDIMFYTFLLSVLIALILLLLCMKDGTFGIYFDLWRVLLSIPLIILATLPAQLLRDLRRYVKPLSRKSEWTIEELMALISADRKQTERIATCVLESAFVVDSSCEKQV